MDLKDDNDNIQEYVNKLRKMFHKNKIENQNQQDLKTFTNLLVAELKQARENELALQKSLQNLVQDENTDFSNKYLELKEKYRGIEQQLCKIKEEYDIASLLHIADTESLKIDFAEKQKHLEELYQEKIKMLEEYLAEEKKCHQDSVKRLEDERQWTNKQRGEIESDLKRKIVDMSTKLRQAENVIRDLNMKQKSALTKQPQPLTSNALEFTGIKELPHHNFNTPSRPASNLLASTTINTPHQNNNNYNILTNHANIERANRAPSLHSFASNSTIPNANNTTISIMDDDITMHLNETELQEIENAYSSLNASSNVENINKNEALINKNESHKLHSKNINLPTNEFPKMVHVPATYTKNSHPPLKQCSNSKNNMQNAMQSGAIKRRKLYNPDDLTYLDGLKKY